MKTGFWLKKDIDTALETTLLNNGEESMIFLHGICGIFALALHDIFGYDVEYTTDETDDGDIDTLIHVFCSLRRNDDCKWDVIDIRGITDDFDEFWEDFEDFSCYPERYDLNVDEFIKKLKKEIGKETFKNYYDVAVDFINNHREYYKC